MKKAMTYTMYAGAVVSATGFIGTFAVLMLQTFGF
jgi:hypothetical protein